MATFKRAGPGSFLERRLVRRESVLGGFLQGSFVLGLLFVAAGCSDKDRETVPAVSEPTFDLDGQTWKIKAVAKDESETCGLSFTAIFEISQDGGDITYVRLLDTGDASGDSLVGTAFSETNLFPDFDRFEGAPIFPGADRIVDLEGGLDVEIVDSEGNSQAVRVTITDSALVVDEGLGVMDGNLELAFEGCQGQWQVFSTRVPEDG